MDAREKEIQALSKKYLAINKHVRLLGKDGVIQIPFIPDKFYLDEIAGWLANAKDFAPHNFNEMKADYVIESIGYDIVKEANFEVNDHVPGVYPQKSRKNVTLIEIYTALSEEQLLIADRYQHELDKTSFSHHRFLSKALNKISGNHYDFVAALSEKTGMPIRTGSHYYPDCLNLIRKVHSDLLHLEEKGYYDIIPQLYSLRDHGVIMASHLSEVFKYEVEEWGLLYTYGYSHATSHAFLIIIKEFLRTLIKRFETLIAKSPAAAFPEAPEQLNNDKFVLIPTDTKGKVKLIKTILGVDEGEVKEENKALNAEPFQIMILLRALQETGIIKKNIDKFHFALAYQILTGGSASYFEKQYITDKLTSANLKQLCKQKQSKKVKEQIALLKELLSNDVTGFLNELENLDQLSK